MGEHWRENCRIKGFVIPYDREMFRPVLVQSFMGKTSSFPENDTYDCSGVLSVGGVPVMARYERRRNNRADT